MADTIETVKGMIPDVDFSNVVTLVTMLIIFLVFVVVIGVLTFFIIQRLKYNKRIIIFRKVAGRFEPAKKDMAMEVRFGEGGDTVFYIRRAKKYQPTPTIQTGRNTYWFAQREDGELINIGIEDIDERMRQVKAHFLDKEMRYSRVSLQKNLRERYQKPSFWSVYGGLIAYVALIAITGIMMWLLFDKYLEIANSVNLAIDASKQVMDTAKGVLVSASNIQSGSGITPS